MAAIPGEGGPSPEFGSTKLPKRTIESYVAAVAGPAKHYWRSPGKISAAEIRDYPLEENFGSRRVMRVIIAKAV